jgi:diacylglycerol kinase (ATP)
LSALLRILNPVHLLNAGRYSSKGFGYMLRSERAFQQELILLAAGVPLAIWLGDSGVERALLIGSILLVMLVEVLNSAIETVLDRVSLEQHELSGRVKDLGSFAVLIALVNMVVVWALVLLN